MPAIKICGITRVEDLKLCEELGVEYVGLNFVPTSPRCITIKQARMLIEGLRHTKAVGVFVGGARRDLTHVLDGVPLHIVQIYNPSLEELLMIKERKISVIHAFRSVPPAEELMTLIGGGDQILLDGAKNGSMADLITIARLPASIRQHLFLAGGLTPENVAAAIDMVRPLAVDVASGVESAPGVKDEGKTRTYVHAVRSMQNPKSPTNSLPSAIHS